MKRNDRSGDNPLARSEITSCGRPGTPAWTASTRRCYVAFADGAAVLKPSSDRSDDRLARRIPIAADTGNPLPDW
ncbi:MAG TPA: hypothetical protein VFI54_27335 [Solirubrobacteraceae bacterium]|nr:hypothetical protein [Solirubrobacteraceae bacterium]